MKSILIASALLLSQVIYAQQDTATVNFRNPPGVATPNGYSHAVSVDLGGSTMIIMSGQVALNDAGVLIGKGDISKQTSQVFSNIETIVRSFGGSMDNIVKLSYFVRDVKDVQKVRDARNKFINLARPPASSLFEVNKLFRDDLLIEIEATAIIKKII